MEGNDNFDFSVAASLLEVFVDGAIQEYKRREPAGLANLEIQAARNTLQIASPRRLSLFSYFVLRDYRLEVTLCNSKEIG